MIKICKDGVTRCVILTPRYAIKIPSLYSWRHFLKGILGNDQEAQWSQCFRWTRKLCPVLWTCPGRFVVVMPRAKVLTKYEFRSLQNTIAHYVWIDGVDEDLMPAMPCELKADSFGWLGGRLVILDYGS